MRLLPITSSSIAAIGWRPYLSPEDCGYLGVMFQNGTCYLYDNVPMSTFVKVLIDDNSQGSAFNTLVKQVGYHYEKVDQQTLADR